MSEPVVAAAPGRRARQAMSGMRTILLPASVAFVTLAAWQAFTAYQHVPEVILPSPLRVWQVLVQNRDILLKHAVPTTLESAGGWPNSGKAVSIRGHQGLGHPENDWHRIL